MSDEEQQILTTACAFGNHDGCVRNSGTVDRVRCACTCHALVYRKPTDPITRG